MFDKTPAGIKRAYDQKRQADIEKGGWKFLRYRKIPTSIKLGGDLNFLL